LMWRCIGYDKQKYEAIPLLESHIASVKKETFFNQTLQNTMNMNE
jgi:hypothetical protein